MMEYYRRLRDLREDHDLSQRAVGAALGISQTAYGRCEMGAQTIRPIYLISLARLYGVSVDYLLGLTDTPTPPPPPKRRG